MQRRLVKKRRFVKKPCFFCQEKISPDYKKPEILAKYLSDRGKILGKDITGICAKHQRRLTRDIKRARHLALLPFIAGV